ncbi:MULTISPECIES: hypothetical protein [Brevibacillus]|jgi:hypothetical protein|uniref:Uncharacterized protein n=1 Tax=Brevibacillus borstelensis AK1 TaxID=1300222 RepID=M8EG04_9BACL|nr:hypothetical protein [Brevibacillus borstelensis]EMT54405.1 hypothetical protein I532_02335 [Brevibacillus borstelensis AK1]MCC0564309.1 hypothetical protein [Brevibacillus borstelensis]MCM3472958.1 hypothetical protein [Brevibacillus borstelensis]MCM3559453.1 hypothetical protein [Brevibacillus borstelensis]MCM3591927.1 hypothetical protein [Brevibacillus borstelensis]
MNVIGIIQTDLNEFSVLFEPEQGGQQQGGQGQGQGQQSQQQGGGDQDDSMFLSFLEDQTGDSSGGQDQGGNSGNQQQNGPQELTVRIKGIPEGQKANFLQMYQIIQDAKDSKDLEQTLTIVNNGDQQNQGAGHNMAGGNNGGGGSSFSGGSNSSKNQ